MKKLYTTLFLTGAISLLAAPTASAQSTTDEYNRDYANYTWIDLGMAQYRENIVTSIMTISGYSGEYYEVPVQEAKEVPGLYRLVNPYGEYFPAAQYIEDAPDLSNYDPSVTEYLYLHCEEQESKGYSTMVWIDRLDSQFHSTQTKLGNYHMSSMALEYYLNQGYDLYDARMVGKCGTLRTGAITFPAKTLMVALDGYYMENGVPRWLAANVDGAFSVILPGGANYEVNCTPRAVCAKENLITIDIDRHPAVNVKYQLFSGRINIQDLDPYALITEEKGLNLAKDQRSVTVKVPAGLHTFVAITVNDMNEAQIGSLCLVYGIDEDQNNWVSLGNTKWRDDFLPTFYSWMDSETIECEIQIRRDGKMLRLVNPYCNHSQHDNLSTHPTDHNHYLTFSIANPNRCEIKYSTLDFGTDGNAMLVGDFVSYWRDNTNYSDDRIAEDGVFGWLSNEDDGTWLRYDTTCITARMGDDAAPWRVCNGDINNSGEVTDPGEFGILIPLEAIDAYMAGLCDGIADADPNAPVYYFNLQGQPVENPTSGTLVIRKQGSKVTKEIVR